MKSVGSIKHRGRAGITLLEVLLASGLMASALGTVALMSSSTEKAYLAASAVMQVEQRLHQALQRARSELAASGPAYLSPPNLAEGIAFDQISFRRVEGHDGLNPLAGELESLTLELAEGELDDGIDNNGDGLIDERVLLLRTATGTGAEKRVILCHQVREYFEGESPDGEDDNGNQLIDEPGFHIVRDGSLLTLRLSISGRDEQGRVIVRSGEVVVAMKN